jgi:hypothetical protein
LALQSQSFSGNAALEACLVKESAHLVEGTREPHVVKVQRALVVLDGALINSNEVSAATYADPPRMRFSRTSASGRFRNFVLINKDTSHPDHGTLLHEMIHCSDDRFMNDIHDDDTDSVFSQASNRNLLKDVHARFLNVAFFKS